MNLEIIEHHPQWVLEAFRRGEFDGLEVIGEADERDFFELAIKEKMLERLAQSMPTARVKEEVPRWFILAANLSLKLHVENSFLAWERVVKCGGLLKALPPGMATKWLNPETRAMELNCQGFNDKNSYDRKTPCDQDTLRKAVIDVPASQWVEWFNHEVQKIFQADGFFDPEGIFIGDGSYLFVPDHEAYEGSQVLWFDEHNHPVDCEKLDPQQRKKAHRERCYKMVTLLHLRGKTPCSVYAAVALVKGGTHESPVLFELVKNFVATVGPGVMKRLILDRAFIDGVMISHFKQILGVDVLIPIKKNMDLWEDAWALAGQHSWVEEPKPQPRPSAQPTHRPEAIRKREAKRQQTLAQRKQEQPPVPAAEQHVRTEVCTIADFRSWSSCRVPIHVVLIRETYGDGHIQQWALLDTATITDAVATKRQYGLRTQIEERHRALKCFYDLSDFRSRRFNVITAQVVMVLLAFTLRQWQLWKYWDERLASSHPNKIHRHLNFYDQYVVIYYQGAYAQMPLLTFTKEALELETESRARALVIVRRLEQSMLNPMTNPRPDATQRMGLSPPVRD
jgi:hypothetical protein